MSQEGRGCLVADQGGSDRVAQFKQLILDFYDCKNDNFLVKSNDNFHVKIMIVLLLFCCCFFYSKINCGYNSK